MKIFESFESNEVKGVNGMDDFLKMCKNSLLKWYESYRPQVDIKLDDLYVVWSCKTLQNYKALLSTAIGGDGIYAEYTYNGDKNELYEDVYGKLTNSCITDHSRCTSSFLKHEYIQTDVRYHTLCAILKDQLSEVPDYDADCRPSSDLLREHLHCLTEYRRVLANRAAVEHIDIYDNLPR